MGYVNETLIFCRHDFVIVQTIDFDEEEEYQVHSQQQRTITPQQPPAQLVQPEQAPQQPQVPVPPKEDEDVDMEMEDEEFEPEVDLGAEVKVRPDFDPRAKSSMYQNIPLLLLLGNY